MKKEPKEDMDVEMAPVSPVPSVPIDIEVDARQFQRPKTTNEKLDGPLDDLIEEKEFDSDEEVRKMNRTLDRVIKESFEPKEKPKVDSHPYFDAAFKYSDQERVDAIMGTTVKGSTARGSNDPPPSGTKGQLEHAYADPMSPESIRKKGRQQHKDLPVLMEWHYTSAYPKYMLYHGGKLHLVVADMMKGLTIKPEHYAPVLMVKASGEYRYVDVEGYNERWLKYYKDNGNKVLRNIKTYVPLDPLAAWIEDRWIFVRRMVGDELCQKAFYRVCTFVWIANGIQRGQEVQQYQNALIEDVFGYNDRKEFVNRNNLPTEVETFNGEYSGYITEDFLKKLVTRIMIVGPFAAFFRTID